MDKETPANAACNESHRIKETPLPFFVLSPGRSHWCIWPSGSASNDRPGTRMVKRRRGKQTRVCWFGGPCALPRPASTSPHLQAFTTSATFIDDTPMSLICSIECTIHSETGHAYKRLQEETQSNKMRILALSQAVQWEPPSIAPDANGNRNSPWSKRLCTG